MATTDAAEQLEEMKNDHRSNTYRNVDIRLSSILDLTFDVDDSNKDGRISLRVVADGAVISGSVISEDAWAEAQIASFEPHSENFANALQILQGGWAEGRKQRDEERANSDEPRALRTKMHFDKATIITGGTNIVVPGLRVDLKHVSAWSVGEMAQSD